MEGLWGQHAAKVGYAGHQPAEGGKGQNWHGQCQAGVWPVKVTISWSHALIDSYLNPSPLGLLHRCRLTQAKLVKAPGAKSAGEGQIHHRRLKPNTLPLAFWPFEAPYRQGY